ncbi:unnamed protein product [Closterium sp. Naga37s-1]|nr:unnamed protein product [Closterium sp. Naga37s-1]
MGLLPFPVPVRPVFARVLLPLRMPCGFGAASGGSRGGQESGESGVRHASHQRHLAHRPRQGTLPTPPLALALSHALSRSFALSLALTRTLALFRTPAILLSCSAVCFQAAALCSAPYALLCCRTPSDVWLLPSNPRRYKFSSGPKLLLPPYSIADIRVTCEALRARPYWNDNINVECYRAADESLPLSIDNDAAPLIGVAKLRLPVLFQDLGGPLSSSPSIFSSSSLSRAANTSMSGSASASARASIASGSVRADSASSSVLNSACDDFLEAARSVGEAQVKHRNEFISELGRALTDSKKQATALLHEVEELKWQLGQAQHQSKHLKSRVTDYEALGAGSVDERIEVLRTHLAEAEWNAEQAATDVWEKDKEIKDLKAKLASMELELQAMTEREEALVALQERTEEKRAGLEEELAQVQEEMQRVTRRKADMEADMRRRVAEAESAMAAAQAREKGLEERRRAAVVEERKLKARVLELKTEVARAGTHSTSSFKAVAQVAALRFQKERLLREKENLEKKLKEATGQGAGGAVAVAAVAAEASNETIQKLEQELAHTQEMLEAERSAAAEAATQREAMRGEVEELRREVEALSARSKEEADGQQAEEQDPIASASEEELREQLQSALEQWEKTKNFSRLLQGQVFEQKKRIRELEGELKRSDAGPLKERLEKVEEEARALGQYVEQLERERAQGGADPAEVEAMRADLQAMREEVGQRRMEHEHLMQELNIMHRNHQEELAEAHRQRDAATGELRALQRQLEEEEEARAEAERRRVESERRRAAVEQERNETEMEASTLKQKLSRLQRQLSELNYARSKSGEHEERAVKEQAAKVVQLQEEVERLSKMGQEAERLRAEVMARDAKLKAEEARITQFVSKLSEFTELNETMERKLREQSAMEAAVYEVTAADTRKPGHVVRLRKKTAYSCAVCKLAGRGLCWRCTHSTCADYIHPQCLTKG